MILKKVKVNKKLSLGQYEVQDNKGNNLTLYILPRKRLLNYIKIEKGDDVYMSLSSDNDTEGRLVNKHGFMDNDDLFQQKQTLDADTGEGLSS